MYRDAQPALGSDATPEPGLDVTGLTVSRGAGNVLRELSLSLPSGSMVGLVGKNGAGKTTLLETIAGLLPSSTGRVRLGEADLTNRPPHVIARQGIALVPEGRKLFPGMTVLENIALGVHRRRWWYRQPPNGSLDVVWELFPDLHGQRHTRCGALSGGQQQMVAVGRALASMPRVLMLDEPTFGLSPQLTEAICMHLTTLKMSGFAILLAEQNLDVVLEMVPKVAIIGDGSILATGTPEELRDSTVLHKAMFGTHRQPF